MIDPPVVPVARGVRLLLAGVVAALVAAAPAHAGAPPEAPITGTCPKLVVPVGNQICGTLNPNAPAVVDYYFAWNAGSSCQGGQTTTSREASGQAVEASGELTGLLPETTYAACIVATNEFGETPGNTTQFTTPPVPETPLISDCVGPIIAGAGQKLCGIVNPHSSTRVSYYFIYNTGFGCTVGGRTPTLQSESEAAEASGEIGGLRPGPPTATVWSQRTPRAKRRAVG